MKNIVTVLFCLLTFSKVYSSNKDCLLSELISITGLKDNGNKMTIEEKLKKYEGAFQIQVKSMRMKPSIPYNIDELIEKNRKQDENVIISLGTDVRLKVFSVSEAKSNTGKEIPMIVQFND